MESFNGKLRNEFLAREAVCGSIVSARAEPDARGAV